MERGAGAPRCGNLTTRTDARGQVATYNYDALNRVTQASYGDQTVIVTWDSCTNGIGRLCRIDDGSGSSTYSYDLSGNRTSQTLNGSLTTYTTPTGSNRLQSLSGAQAKSYGYDNAGNQTASGSLAYGYDNAGRKTRLTIGGQTWTYAYSALGERVRKAGPGGTTLYAYDLQGHLLGEYDGAGNLIQETVWLGDTPVATIRPGGAVYYVHADHLNTPRRITRVSDNRPVWEWESAPFGDTLANENPAGLGAFAYPLRFPGQVYDAESGTNYNFFRDYDSSTGRYVQSDPIGLRGGINTYSYVGSNPISRTDRFGLFEDGRLAAILAGAAPETLGDIPLGHSDMYGGEFFDFTEEDHDFWTRPENPITGTWRHFRPIEDVIPEVEAAIASCNRRQFARKMHQLHDYFSHYALGYRWGSRDPNTPCGGLGHACESGDDPRNPDRRRDVWDKANDFGRQYVDRFLAKCSECRN